MDLDPPVLRHRLTPELRHRVLTALGIVDRHLPGLHDQSTHGRPGAKGVVKAVAKKLAKPSAGASGRPKRAPTKTRPAGPRPRRAFDVEGAAESFDALDAAPTRARVLYEASLSPAKRKAFLAKLDGLSDAQAHKLGGQGARAVIGADDQIDNAAKSRITDSVDDYMRTGYKSINRALYEAAGGPLGDDVAPGVRRRIDDIDLLLSLSRTDQDSILYRGTRFEGDPPDELTSHLFNSATANDMVARDFAKGEFMGIETGSTDLPGTPTVMEIRVPRGTPAVQLSPMHVAAEVLLNRGLKLRKVQDRGMFSGARYVVYEITG